MPSAPREIAPGDVVLNKYRFERLLGEGGQGCVWQAQNQLLGLPVAIKIVHPDSRDRSLPERLFREARAAAMLGHPAIVRVLDLGQAPDGAPFLVMELLRGESLADRLTQVERFTPERALRVLLPIADALVAAHAHGVVHRDVKPDNVFLAVSGADLQPKLLDFGIARLTHSSLKPRTLTSSGAILGTPAYLSPEQAEGLDDVDFRADIWSFCAMAYECLSGVVPFADTSWLDLRRRILEGEPRPLADFGIEDAQLWQILRRGLEKSPENRWSSMLGLGRALACWLIERGVTEDICGGALAARWLRCEPLAIELLGSATTSFTSIAVEHPAVSGHLQSAAAEPGVKLKTAKVTRKRALAPLTVVGVIAGSAALVLIMLIIGVRAMRVDPGSPPAGLRQPQAWDAKLTPLPKGDEPVPVVEVARSEASAAPPASALQVQPVEVVNTPPSLPARPRGAAKTEALGAWSKSQAVEVPKLVPKPSPRAIRSGVRPSAPTPRAASPISDLEPMDPY